MTVRLLSLVWLVAGLLLGAAPARAQQLNPPDPSQDLYREALDLINEGRKSDATDVLNKLLAAEPLHAGAWLELALLQCSLGNGKEAERLFQAVIVRFAPSQGIIDLIEEARALGCNNWYARSDSVLSLARGYDGNVNQGASDPTLLGADGSSLSLSTDFQPKSDSYSLIGADYLREVTRNGATAFAQFQLRRNDVLHQYDTASLFAGVENGWRFGKYTVRGTAMAGLITLGNARYQHYSQLQGRIGKSLGKTMGAQLMASVSHTNYLTLTNFDSDGSEVRAQFNYRDRGRSASVSMALLNDQASGMRPGGNRHGKQMSIQGSYPLSPELNLDLRVQYQDWRSQLVYSQGLIDIVRMQRTMGTRAALSYAITPTQTLMLEWRTTENRENISIFQYKNQQVQLNWQWHGR